VTLVEKLRGDARFDSDADFGGFHANDSLGVGVFAFLRGYYEQGSCCVTKKFASFRSGAGP
jgi:hypothetical protein